jgi:RND family efflux transporter MFP subunit
MNPSVLLRTLLLIVLFGIPGCRRAEPGDGTVPIAVQAAPVVCQEMTSETRYSATVLELRRATLSFKVAGTVAALLQVPGIDGRLRDVQEGDEVRAGEEIARLDTSDYARAAEVAREQLAAAENQLTAAASTADAARKDFDRVRALFRDAAVSQQQLDQATTRREATQGTADAAARTVAQARLAVQQAESDLASCRLIVPELPGVYVAAKLVEPSERVAPLRPVFVLMDLSRLRVVFAVPDSAVGDRRIGEAIPVVAEALGGQKFAGRVSKIARAADPGTRTFHVELTIDRPGQLRPGMIVTIATGRRSEGMPVPLPAVQRGTTRQDYAVYQVVEENGRTVARKRAVELAGMHDNRVLIRLGGKTAIRPGDRIVVAGAARLEDGQAVQVIEDGGPSGD